MHQLLSKPIHFNRELLPETDKKYQKLAQKPCKSWLHEHRMPQQSVHTVTWPGWWRGGVAQPLMTTVTTSNGCKMTGCKLRTICTFPCNNCTVAFCVKLIHHNRVIKAPPLLMCIVVLKGWDFYHMTVANISCLLWGQEDICESISCKIDYKGRWLSEEKEWQSHNCLGCLAAYQLR